MFPNHAHVSIEATYTYSARFMMSREKEGGGEQTADGLGYIEESTRLCNYGTMNNYSTSYKGKDNTTRGVVEQNSRRTIVIYQLSTP